MDDKSSGLFRFSGIQPTIVGSSRPSRFSGIRVTILGCKSSRLAGLQQPKYNSSRPAGLKLPDYNRGTVLVIALFVVVILAGLTAAYLGLVSSRSKEVYVSSDDQQSYQSDLAGFDMVRCYLTGKFTSGTSGWDTELSDCLTYMNNTTSGDGVGPTDIIYGVGTITTSFRWATNIDYFGSTYLATITNNSDGGSATDDTDNQVIITVTATRSSNITVNQAMNQGLPVNVVQAFVKYKPPVYEPESALVTGGSCKLSGNATISGTQGSIYANDNVEIAGSAYVEQEVYSTGNITGGDPANNHEGQPATDVPVINPANYAYLADYELRSNGDVYSCTAHAVVANAVAAAYWGWQLQAGTWKYNSGTNYYGTIYVSGGTNVNIAGSPGTALAPWQLTLLATGNVSVSGSPTMVPYTDSLGILALKDIEITGNLTLNNGVVGCHEQMSIKGSVDIVGVVVAEDATNTVGSLIAPGSSMDVTIGGQASITYNGGMITILDMGDPYVQIKGFKRIR